MLAAAAAIAALASPAFSQDALVATVDGVEITERDLRMAADDLGENLHQIPEAQRRDYLVSYLTDLEIVAGAAREAGVEDDETYTERMAYIGKRLLMEVYLDRRGEEATTEEAMRELYDEIVGQAEDEIEVRARHILVETEEAAGELHAELVGGADFEELAQEHSIDPGSGQQGGDLGYFTSERMIPEFSEVAFSLEPGDLSDPVQSQFGWHIIRVEDRREVEKPSFEDVSGELRTVVARRAQRDHILELREGADIQIEGATPQAETGAGEDAPAEAQ